MTERDRYLLEQWARGGDNPFAVLARAVLGREREREPETETERERTVHVFGGVRFVETGEVRCARDGEWILFSVRDMPVLQRDGLYVAAHPILRYAPEVSDA